MSLSLGVVADRAIETIININILKRIEQDLDIDEKISILFLIIDDYTEAFHYIFRLFRTRTENPYIIVTYVNEHPENWQEKILEALCILNNREIIRKLKLSFHDLDLLYVPKFMLFSKSISVIAKCLYRLCESLDENKQKLLLNSVKCDIFHYDPLDNVNYLELHILYWMHSGYITVSKDKSPNFNKLLKHLKNFNDGHLKIISIELERFQKNLHVVDNCISLGTNKNYLQLTPSKRSSIIEGCRYKKYINNGLCIIINQKYFKKEYKPRYGTEADCITLSETFQAFGFQVEILRDLGKNDMLRKIKNISKDHGNKYDCLLLCILSHGYKGGVITSDEKNVSLETIERAVCCLELKDVIKIVIIQACQGKTQGTIDHCLTIDGLPDSLTPIEDIHQFTDFFMFMSTMQGFLSIRHEEKGSWFIQEVCKVFKTYGNELTFMECVRKTIKSIREKIGIIEGNQIAQLPEIRNYRLLSDFQLKQVTSTV